MLDLRNFCFVRLKVLFKFLLIPKFLSRVTVPQSQACSLNGFVLVNVHDACLPTRMQKIKNLFPAHRLFYYFLKKN